MEDDTILVGKYNHISQIANHSLIMHNKINKYPIIIFITVERVRKGELGTSKLLEVIIPLND